MTLSIAISPDIEAKLRERARAFGRDVEQYAADLISQGVTAPTFDEILTPVRQDFAQSGLSPEEIDSFGRGLIDQVRSARPADHP